MNEKTTWLGVFVAGLLSAADDRVPFHGARTGQIYPSKDEGLKDLMAKGVPEQQIQGRLVFGTMKDLRKLRKRLRKQLRREAEGKR
jgi:hypothetical protein